MNKFEGPAAGPKSEQKEAAKKEALPALEDFKGWQKVVEARVDALKSWKDGPEKQVKIGLEVTEMNRMSLSRPNYALGNEEPLEKRSKLSPLQKQALELANAAKDENLQKAYKAFLEESTAEKAEIERKTEEEIEKARDEYFKDQSGESQYKYKLDTRIKKLRNEERKEIEKLRQSIMKKYPLVQRHEAKADAIQVEHERLQQELADKERQLEDSIIEARKLLEAAEWRALHGNEPMHHPLDTLRQLVASGSLEKAFQKGDAEDRKEFIQGIERDFYLKGSEYVIARLVAGVYRGDLAPNNSGAFYGYYTDSFRQ